MSNTNAPFGFRPTMRTVTGASGRLIAAHKIATYATALFMNDAVTHAANGTQNCPAIDTNITPGTTPILGVNLVYGAASTATSHTIVLASAGAVFQVQGDGTGATYLVAASLSKNANLVTAAGNTSLLTSKQALSETSLAATNTLDLRVRKLWESPDNALGQYARVEVTFNNLVDSDQKAGI